MECCWSPAEENYTWKWLYLLWVEGGMRVALYLWDTNWSCLCFRNNESPKLNDYTMTIFPYKYPTRPVKPSSLTSQFLRCPVSSQFSFMLTSEPPSQYSEFQGNVKFSHIGRRVCSVWLECLNENRRWQMPFKKCWYDGTMLIEYII